MDKQDICVREDLRLPKGKLAAQVAHGSTWAMKNANESAVNKWLQNGGKKVVVYVKDEKSLLAILQDAKDRGLPCKLIVDTGHTVVSPGTKTVVGIGPAKEEAIDAVTGELSLV